MRLVRLGPVVIIGASVSRLAEVLRPRGKNHELA